MISLETLIAVGAVVFVLALGGIAWWLMGAGDRGAYDVTPADIDEQGDDSPDNYQELYEEPDQPTRIRPYIADEDTIVVYGRHAWRAENGDEPYTPGIIVVPRTGEHDRNATQLHSVPDEPEATYAVPRPRSGWKPAVTGGGPAFQKQNPYGGDRRSSHSFEGNNEETVILPIFNELAAKYADTLPHYMIRGSRPAAAPSWTPPEHMNAAAG